MLIYKCICYDIFFSYTHEGKRGNESIERRAQNGHKLKICTDIGWKKKINIVALWSRTAKNPD